MTYNSCPENNDCYKIKPRMVYLDNLKALLMIFVVMMHAACTYSGIGSWAYIEHRSYGKLTYYFFLFYQSLSQAYFMALFFLISAYFIPRSLEKKGVKKFVQDRLYRLGLPTLIFIAIIHPLWMILAQPNFDLVGSFYRGIISLKIFAWTGPMWFAVILLISSILFAFVQKPLAAATRSFTFAFNVKNILLLTLIIAGGAFVLRCYFPFGTSFFNFQLGNFSAYIILFTLGTVAGQKQLFEKISYKKAKLCLLAAFGIGLPLWCLIVGFWIPFGENIETMQFLGGWNIPAFAYALWESFFCVTFSIALLGIFREKFNSQNRLQVFMSANAFGVYVFHPLILTAVTVMMAPADWPPLFKFLIAVVVAVPLSFLGAALIRIVKPLRILFS
ncbi:MAG: acyltransferase [Bacillota bacterium]